MSSTTGIFEKCSESLNFDTQTADFLQCMSDEIGNNHAVRIQNNTMQYIFTLYIKQLVFYSFLTKQKLSFLDQRMQIAFKA